VRKIFAVMIVMVSATAWAGTFEEGQAALGKKDVATALNLFQQAAEQGDERAQVGLGNLYKDGGVLKQDYAKAAYWYALAANQGNAGAMLFLASLLIQGKGVPQDEVQAASLFKIAAAEGLVDAQFFLGRLYESGRGLQQNVVLAHMWLNLSAAQGDGTAQERRDNLARLMTRDQYYQAQKLARECLARDYKNCD